MDVSLKDMLSRRDGMLSRLVQVENKIMLLMSERNQLEDDILLMEDIIMYKHNYNVRQSEVNELED